MRGNKKIEYSDLLAMLGISFTARAVIKKEQIVLLDNIKDNTYANGIEINGIRDPYAFTYDNM